jgi:thymidylate synthase (FAD)
MKVSTVWATPEGEALVAFMARVSNPGNQDNPASAPKLIKYLAKNNHWSPFEMVNICMEIETTRDIARQILRHRSFSFQEFSQRYAAVPKDGFEYGKARMQDSKNRQNSLPTDDEELDEWWSHMQHRATEEAEFIYQAALRRGIAKEVARKVLPEGLTVSRMYMNGTLRSWLHYVGIRCDSATQKEHREVALLCKQEIAKAFPSMLEILNAD